MSGLNAYSKGLDVISNNVANLNTPGYKGNDLLFQDIFYGFQMAGEFNDGFTGLQVGAGVKAESTSIVFRQGDVRQTGEDTDVAIDGSGFFVLQKGDELYFTRSGQFVFDKDGFLVSRLTGMKVAAIDENGELTNISITGKRTSSPSATSEINFTNNLSTGSTRHEIEEVVFDNAGNEHTLKFTFINNSSEQPRSWLVEITDENDEQVGETAEIRFQGNGSPAEDYNSFSFTFSPSESDPFDIQLNFGEPGSFTGVTSFSGGTRSDMSVADKDGSGPGSLTGVEFDREGLFKLKYSNGVDTEGASLALAKFSDLQGLQQIGDGLFLAKDNNKPTISTATRNGLGEVAGASIELSNVELTQQFTNLIIVQRGYQASSQILTVANEMMQQLMQTVSGK
jgi:flagellar hook protein FlgE